MKRIWKKLTVLVLGVIMLLAALPVQAANFCHVKQNYGCLLSWQE